MRQKEKADQQAASPKRVVNQQRWLPAQVFVALCVLVGLVWNELADQRLFALHRTLGSSANKLSSYVEGDIRARIPAIERMAGRWQARGGTPKDEFIFDAFAHIEDLPGFQALGWVDKDFYVRWIVPFEGNEEAQDFYLAAEEMRRIALLEARDNREPTMTGLVDLVQGGKGLLIYFPILVEEEFDGFVSAVFRVDDWLDYVFGLGGTGEYDTALIAALEIEGQQAYTQPGWDPDYQLDWQTTARFELMGHPVSVTVQPTARFFERNATYAPEIVAAGGVLFSVLIAILVYLYQRAGIEAKNAQLASSFLQVEVRERGQVQGGLLRATEGLERRVIERTAELNKVNEDLRVEIEERHRAEESEQALRKQLTQASRRSAVSDMATGLAHELNQPLTAIANYAQVCVRFLRKGTSNQQDVIADLGRIEEQAVRAGEIIRWIRTAIRHDDTGKVPLNINDCIAEIGDLMGSDFNKHGTALVYDLTDGLPMISANKVQLQQVIVNLFQNSLTAADQNQTEKHQVTVRSALDSDRNIYLSVEDNGPGVPAGIRDELFLPFVSTHREGLGFGLSVSRTIIEAHGGRIWLDTEFEDGAAFKISLPTIDGTD